MELFHLDRPSYKFHLEQGDERLDILIEKLQKRPDLASPHIWVEHQYSPPEQKSSPLLIWRITNQSIKNDYYNYDMYPDRDKKGYGTSYQYCPSCRAPLEQRRALILKASYMGKKDISLTYSFDVILSEHMVGLLQEWDVTGFDVRPVQNYGKGGKEKSALYQLQVANVLPPMATPPTEFEQMLRCEVCGNMSRYLKRTHQWGEIKYYEDTDVYYPHSVLDAAKDFNYTTERFGDLSVMRPRTIISQRLYRLLREHKVKYWDVVPVYFVD